MPRLDILNINFFDWVGERRYGGGAERYVLELASLARSIGLEPRLLQNATTAFTRSVEGIEVVGIAACDQIDFAALSRAFAREAEGAALVVASQLELACEIPAGTPALGISHGIWWDDPARAIPDPDPDRAHLFAALERVNPCVCVDTNFINWVRATRGHLQDHLLYLPNFVALDRFRPAARTFEGRLRVLYPRRLTRERGIDDVLVAFDALLAHHPELELALCGGGAAAEEARARAFVARHPGQASWQDLPMEAMASAYEESDVVVVPTQFGEGTSLSCLEAMATHHAVIATQVGGLPNLVIDGFNGLLIAPGAAPLAAAVERLLADRSLARNLAARALEVSRTFGHARWQSGWLAVLQRALGGEGVPAPDASSTATVGIRTRILSTSEGARSNATPADASGIGPAAGGEPARDEAWLAEALRDASAERDRLVDSLRLVVAERDAARRQRESAQLERDALRADAALVRRERDVMQGEALLAHRQRDQLAGELAWARREVETALESAQVQEAGHAAKLAAQRTETTTLRERVVATEQRLAEAVALAEARSNDVATLMQAVASRDAGIAWLRDELTVAYDRFAQRRRSFKLLGADLSVAMMTRVPGLRPVAKALLPQGLRHRFNVATQRHTGNSPPAALMGATTGPDASVTGASGSNAGNGSAGAPIVPGGFLRALHSSEGHRGYDVVCLANIEWGARYQRPQHMMSRFAGDGHRVFYVVASRTPPAGESYHIEAVAPNVFQVALAVPAVQNFYGEALSEPNLSAMADALAALAREHHIHAAVTVVHLPYWTALALSLREMRGWRVVYDCMDEWADFPAIGADLLTLEERLVREADLVTVTAALLEEKWRPHARACLLVRNGVDFAFFERECVPNERLGGIARPIVGYYGALADWVDLELVAAVARAHPAWSFVLLGDVFVKDLAALDTLANVHLMGRRPYAEMPQYLYHFDVCLVPFKLNDVTHAVDPVKFYEYVSAGKPVVSVPLKEMAVYRDYTYFAEGADAFGRAIDAALAEDDPALWARRVALARDNDWAERHRITREAVEGLHPLVSIVVVTYFNAELTRLCLESIFATQTWPRLEVVVVDNASTDETRAYLRYLARARPGQVRVILNERNLGFAAANNQGLAVARGDYLVLLNNDTVVPRGWLEPLMAHLADPAVGLVGPVTNFVGNEARIEVDYRSLDQMEAFAQRYTGERPGRSFDISVLAMFCVMMRREVFERVGNLDERFGVGMFEDDDYSRRLHAAGLRTVCAEDAFVHHFGQAAFKKLIETGEYDALWAANQRHYEAKWGKWSPHQHRQ